MAKINKSRQRRRKLAAHDRGIDRHNKPVAYEKKMTRLTTKYQATQSQPKRSRSKRKKI